MNAVFKYPGAKWSIARWIIDHFPEHHSYLEPFFGSGAVLFTKDRSDIETVNDLDGDVVNAFDWIRRDTEKLAHEVYFTPYSRQVYDETFKRRGIETDSLKRAVDFLTLVMMGRGFTNAGPKTGWCNDVQARSAAYQAGLWCKLPKSIFEAAERLRGVQIECMPAVDLIRRFNFPNVLIYADPPYLLSTRHGKQYKHEMDERDHEELLEALKAHRGPVLLSGYDSELYNDSLRGWYRDEVTTYAQTATKRREILYMNFEPQGQIKMF